MFSFKEAGHYHDYWETGTGPSASLPSTIPKSANARQETDDYFSPRLSPKPQSAAQPIS